MKKFEYYVFYYDGDTNKTIGKLDNMGKDGWELVSVYEYNFYFKREIK